MPKPDADVPRFLHRQSQRGYTERIDKALYREPEAVSETDQDWITHGVHQRERQAQVDEWQTHRDAIARDLDWLVSQPQRRDVDRQVRAVRRQLAAIDARIASA